MKWYGHSAYGLVIVVLLSLLVLSACGSSSNSATPALPAGGTNIPATVAVTAETAAPTQAAQTQAAPTAAASSPTAVQSTSTQTTASATQTPAASIPETAKQTAIPTDTVTGFPDPTGYTWAPVVTGLDRPLGMANPPGGTQDQSPRLFVLEQPGTIRVIQNGKLLPDPFLDITARVGSQGNEQGLLGIALHPKYAQNGYFYINYTDKNGDTVIARYQASPNDPNKADPNSEKVLLRVDQPFPNHNGGSMVFGPDGYLYMGLGDGGSGGDPHGNGQSTNTLLGKILRVDVDNGDPYAILADNPFATSGGKPEIWAYGLRNPWRFSFDRLTGDLYIADVGQDLWEEVDFLPAGSPGGANFGWNYREGMHPFKGTPPANANLIDPVYEFPHGPECSVTGGYVYRGQALPEFRGIYLFSDYCSGKVWGLLRGANGAWQSQQLFDSGYNVSSFGEDANGEIYLIDQKTGGVYRLQKK